MTTHRVLRLCWRWQRAFSRKAAAIGDAILGRDAVVTAYADSATNSPAVVAMALKSIAPPTGSER